MIGNRLPHDWMADIASLLAIVGAFAQLLPAVATLMAIAWYAILIFESRTVQRVVLARKVVEDAAAEARAKVETAADLAHATVEEAAQKAKEVLAGETPPPPPPVA
jgi:hypothetical protein